VNDDTELLGDEEGSKTYLLDKIFVKDIEWFRDKFLIISSSISNGTLSEAHKIQGILVSQT
jgi:hypothetical protein